VPTAWADLTIARLGTQKVGGEYLAGWQFARCDVADGESDGVCVCIALILWIRIPGGRQELLFYYYRRF
jgi:hypothetical protein